MKRLGLLSLVFFISVALLAEGTLKDFSTKPSLTLLKKSKIQAFRDGNTQPLPSLFSSSEDDKMDGLSAKPLFHSPLGNCLGGVTFFSGRHSFGHTLAYRYLFLPPPV